MNIDILDEDSLHKIGSMIVDKDCVPLRGDNIVCNGERYVIHRKQFNADNGKISVLVKKFIPNTGGF